MWERGRSFSFIIFSCTFHDFYHLHISSAFSFLSFNKSLIIVLCLALVVLLPLWSLLLSSQALLALGSCHCSAAVLYWVTVSCSLCVSPWLNYESFDVSDYVFFIFMSQCLAWGLAYNYSINLFRNSVSKGLPSLFVSVFLDQGKECIVGLEVVLLIFRTASIK